MAETIQFEQVMENLAGTLPSLYAIATVFFIVGGLWLTFFAIFRFGAIVGIKAKISGYTAAIWCRCDNKAIRCWLDVKFCFKWSNCKRDFFDVL